MNKKTLNEAGICDNYVTPAITGAGWDAHTRRSAANTGLHGRPDHRSGQAGRARGEEAGRLPPVLPSRTFRWRWWRPRTTTTRSAAGCSRPSLTRRPSTCPSCSRRMATLPVPRPNRTVLPGRAADRPGRISLPGRPVAALPRLERTRRRIRQTRPAALLRGPRRQGAPLLPARRHPAGGGRRSHGAGAGCCCHGHGHGKNPHRLPDHLAAVESEKVRRVLFLVDRNILCRPDHDQRLQALRPGDDQGRDPQHGPELRGLPGALPGRQRKRGRKERLQAVQPRLLRPGGHRRMPPGQRPRGQRVAGDPRLLRARHPARPDRHPRRRPPRSAPSPTSASRSTRTPSSRVSRTDSSRLTRSSASTSTRTCRAGGHRRA